MTDILQPPPGADVVLAGELTRADHETYRELAFDVPAGVEPARSTSP